MIVVPQVVLTELMTQIVRATHGLQDVSGAQKVVGTIAPETMRSAALVALQIAIGDAVWPADRPITIPKREIAYGLFREG